MSECPKHSWCLPESCGDCPNDRESLTEYISGLDRETIDRLGGTCPSGGRCIEAAEEAALWKEQAEGANKDLQDVCDTIEKLRASNTELVAECDRLLSANDTLVERIEDLTEGYALEDTCPRVQCRTTSRRLHSALRESQHANTEWARECDRLRSALERIASTNPDKRPDGTYNVSRMALIQIAQRALVNDACQQDANGKDTDHE